jgi:hypothetical protein
MVEKPEVETAAQPASNSRAGWIVAGLVVVIVAVVAGVILLSNPKTEPGAVMTDPKALLEEVIDNLRSLKTFRLLIEQSGAPYVFGITLDEGVSTVSAIMERADAQYENPNILYASTKLRIAGLPPLTVEIFARGNDQWFKLIGTGWINYPVAEGFDPGRLIQADSGFPAALQSLTEVNYIGEETLPDGTAAHHITGIATGQVINDLMFGLLSLTQDKVQVDAYIDVATNLPALLLVTLPDTATEDEPQDTVWRIETYDFDGQSEIVYPDGKASGDAEATAEATESAEASATAEATESAEASATAEATEAAG